jgi:hypothetical protein
MRQILLKALPDREQSLTQTKMCQAIIPFVFRDLFLDGSKVGWGETIAAVESLISIALYKQCNMLYSHSCFGNNAGSGQPVV